MWVLWQTELKRGDFHEAATFSLVYRQYLVCLGEDSYRSFVGFLREEDDDKELPKCQESPINESPSSVMRSVLRTSTCTRLKSFRLGGSFERCFNLH